MIDTLLASRLELHVLHNHFCECSASVCYRVLCPNCGRHLAIHYCSDVRASNDARGAYDEHTCIPTGIAPQNPKWW